MLSGGLIPHGIKFLFAVKNSLPNLSDPAQQHPALAHRDKVESAEHKGMLCHDYN